ncbi:MAG TPA: hypothetical protein DET40_25390 [Lentisphaeria bacterium]|nr:MAG: hypothetical protein A2X45_18575 [Lentisphaerae bacterium GWF2_50_93]HCE46896.1 hypothetical protein [Lentisphaeria bacterium]
MTKKNNDIIYLVNERDDICFVNGKYEEFAAANAGNAAASKSVLHQSLWNFVTDITTQELYRSALRKVREGNRLRFKFRCDSPDCRRMLEMNMQVVRNREVEFRIRTISEKKRPVQALWDPLAIRSKDLLRVCSWCKKIQVGDDWMEVEKAVTRLSLFERSVLPSVSHGICDQCYKEIADILEAS